MMAIMSAPYNNMASQRSCGRGEAFLDLFVNVLLNLDEGVRAEQRKHTLKHQWWC